MVTKLPSVNPAGVREWSALAVLTLTVMLLAVDGTVLALAVPALSAALEPTATQLLWIGDIYSFALAGLLVTMGNLADRIGRKKLLLIGATGFGLASALAAFSPSAEGLIAARALLGISGATLMPSTLSIIRQIFVVPAQRTRAIAVWSFGAMGGAAMGPLVGGALLENFRWGSVFLINLPVMAVLLISGILILPESKNPHAGKIDLASAGLSILAIVPIVYAVKQVFGYGITVLGIAALLLGLVSGWAFWRRQRKLTTPMLDVALFRVPAFTGAILANGLSVFALSGLLFFFSQYLQLVRGFGPLQAGLAELPITIAAMSVVLFVGWVSVKFGVGRSIGSGLILGALGFVFLAVAEGLENYLWLALALAATGFGVGLAMTLATDAVVASAPRERAGAASSLSETAYELGIAGGIAILGSLLTNLYRNNLPNLEALPEPVRAGTTDSLAAGVRLLKESGLDVVLTQVQHAFTTAMQTTSVVAAVLLLAAGILAWKLIPARLEADQDLDERIK